MAWKTPLPDTGLPNTISWDLVTNDGTDNFYVVGRLDPNRYLVRYTVSTNSWITLTPPPDFGEVFPHAVHYYNGKIYIFHSESTPFRNLLIYTISSDSWVTLSPRPVPFTSGVLAHQAQIKNKLYVWEQKSDGTNTRTLYEYNTFLDTSQSILTRPNTYDLNASLCSDNVNTLYRGCEGETTMINLNTLIETTIPQPPGEDAFPPGRLVFTTLGLTFVRFVSGTLPGGVFLFNGTSWKDLDAPFNFLNSQAVSAMGRYVLIPHAAGQPGGGIVFLDDPARPPFRFPTRWMDIANAA